MKEFLQKNWGYLVLVLIMIGMFAYYNIELNKKNNQIYVRDSVEKLDSVRYKVLAEEYKTVEQANNDLRNTNKELAEYLKKNNEDIRSLSNIVLKLKNQTFERIVDTVTVFERINDTTFAVKEGDDVVNIQEEVAFYKILGKSFLFPQKGYTLDFIGKPMNLDIVVTEDNNGVFHGYVDTKDKDLELLDMNVRVLREEKSKSFWENLEGMSSLNFTNRNGFGTVGMTYKRVGVQGVVGYDYTDFNIDRSNLFYGLGLIIKF